MTEPLLVGKGLGKNFRNFASPAPSTLKGLALSGFKKGRGARVWALRDVDIEVSAGQMVAVVGHNGSGKSTLLRLLGGVMQPDQGNLMRHGRTAGLLDLNVGMHAELSGLENLKIGGVVAGLTRRQVLDRLDEIVAFAELQDFINAPFRTYSSGMKMRLGFAVAAHVDPDILLIDEVLSVGDLAFQAKCLKRIEQIKQKGTAVVLISHDLQQVERLADEVIWLRDGLVVAKGPPSVIVGDYRAEMALKSREATPLTVPDQTLSGGRILRVRENRFGSMEMQITAVRMLDGNGEPATSFAATEPVRIEIDYHSEKSVAPIVGLSIGSEEEEVIDISSEGDRVEIPAGSQRVAVSFEKLDLTPGTYALSVGLYEPRWTFAYDYHWRAYPLSVVKFGTADHNGARRQWSVD